MSGQTAGHDGTGTSTRTRIVVATVLVAVVGAAAALAATAGPRDDADAGPPAEIERLIDLATVRTETSAPRRDPASQPTVDPATPGAPAPAPPPEVAGPPATAIGALDAVPRTGGTTDLLRRYFGAVTVEAIVIVQCESGFDPNALNTNTDGSQDHGLFQINDVHERAFEPVTGHPWTARYDPEINTAFAAWLYDHAGGWGPWRCNRNLEQFDEPAP